MIDDNPLKVKTEIFSFLFKHLFRFLEIDMYNQKFDEFIAYTLEFIAAKLSLININQERIDINSFKTNLEKLHEIILSNVTLATRLAKNQLKISENN